MSELRCADCRDLISEEELENSCKECGAFLCPSCVDAHECQGMEEW